MQRVLLRTFETRAAVSLLLYHCFLATVCRQEGLFGPSNVGPLRKAWKTPIPWYDMGSRADGIGSDFFFRFVDGDCTMRNVVVVDGFEPRCARKEQTFARRMRKYWVPGSYAKYHPSPPLESPLSPPSIACSAAMSQRPCMR